MKTKNIVALSGGVGGAKLVYGLAQHLNAKQLTVLTNTADDFQHLGLYIAPDLDSVMYALAEINNTELGWGITGETWHCMQAVQRLQGDTWFRLGDQDIATHLLRSEGLRQGKSLTQVTCDLFQRLGITANVLPMCDEKVSTMVQTAQGELSFQHYFVQQQCQPAVTGFYFQGIEQARLGEMQQQALDTMDAMIICPSNPFVSVAPILAIAGVKEAMQSRPVAVVSPIIGQAAVKGPAAKMMQELNMPVSATAVAQVYQGMATHFVLDVQDAAQQQAIERLGYQVLCTQTLMQSNADKTQLAATLLDWLDG